MKYEFRIAVLLFILCLLYPFTVNAAQARLKKIRVVTGGTLKERNRMEDIRIFVNLIQPDGTLNRLDTRYASLNDKIFVKSGANLLMEYRRQEAWLNYNTRVRIEQDRVKIEQGELYVPKQGRWFGTDKLALLGYSEYYLKVEEDGKTTLYVIEGEVQARDEETEKKKIVSQSMAIDESLREIKLPKEEIRRILMWRGQLKFRLSPFARMGRWIKNHWWTIGVGAAAGIIVREVFFSPELYVEVELP